MRTRGQRIHSVSTIGYAEATVAGFLEALRTAGVELVVDVRAVASSRRPGFAKTRLAANLEGAGIEYLHLRGLGTPADGRAAARAGRYDELRTIYLEHLASAAAQADLAVLADLVRAGRVSASSVSRRIPPAVTGAWWRRRSPHACH
jgi:uncharacterized protein (DUF488 family)